MQEKEKNIAHLRTMYDRQETKMEDLRTEVQELKLQINNRRKALENRLAQARTQGQCVQLPSPGAASVSDSDHSIELPPSFSRGPHRNLDHGNPERYPSTSVIPLASTVLHMGTTDAGPESVKHARREGLTRSKQSSKGIWSSFADAASPGRKKISLSKLRPAARFQTVQHVFALSLGPGKEEHIETKKLPAKEEEPQKKERVAQELIEEDVVVLSFESGTVRIGENPSQSPPQIGDSLAPIPSPQTKRKKSFKGRSQVRKSPTGKGTGGKKPLKNRSDENEKSGVEEIDLAQLGTVEKGEEELGLSPDEGEGERQLEELKSPLPVINVTSALSPARSEKEASSDQLARVKFVRIDNGGAATLPPAEALDVEIPPPENVASVAEQPSGVSSVERKSPETISPRAGEEARGEAHVVLGENAEYKETKPAIRNRGSSSSSKQVVPAAEKSSKPHETKLPISTLAAKSTVPTRMQYQTLPTFTLTAESQSPAAAATEAAKSRTKTRPKLGPLHQPPAEVVAAERGLAGRGIRGRSSSRDLPTQLSPSAAPKGSSSIQLTERIKQLEKENARLQSALQQPSGRDSQGGDKGSPTQKGYKPHGSIDSISQLRSHEDSLDSSTFAAESRMGPRKKYSNRGLMTPKSPMNPFRRESHNVQSGFLVENTDHDEIDSNFSFRTDSHDLVNPDGQEAFELEETAPERAQCRPRHSTIVLKKLMTNPDRFKKVQRAGRRIVNKFVCQIYQELLLIYRDSVQSVETAFHLKHRLVCSSCRIILRVARVRVPEHHQPLRNSSCSRQEVPAAAHWDSGAIVLQHQDDAFRLLHGTLAL